MSCISFFDEFLTNKKSTVSVANFLSEGGQGREVWVLSMRGVVYGRRYVIAHSRQLTAVAEYEKLTY